eukprot:5753036-Amphidinium_carterae.1
MKSLIAAVVATLKTSSMEPASNAQVGHGQPLWSNALRLAAGIANALMLRMIFASIEFCFGRWILQVRSVAPMSFEIIDAMHKEMHNRSSSLGLREVPCIAMLVATHHCESSGPIAHSHVSVESSARGPLMPV